MGIGEAAVTILSERGAPTPVAWTMLRPPTSLMAQLDPAVQAQMVAASPLSGEYAAVVDRESAYELLAAKHAPDPAPSPQESELDEPAPRRVEEREPESRVAQVLGSRAFRSFATTAGREIARSLFGTAPRRRRATRRRR
jgi:hypothetical protein